MATDATNTRQLKSAFLLGFRASTMRSSIRNDEDFDICYDILFALNTASSRYILKRKRKKIYRYEAWTMGNNGH